MVVGFTTIGRLTSINVQIKNPVFKSKFFFLDVQLNLSIVVTWGRLTK